MGRPHCTRCLSNKHNRPMCQSRVRCTSCFRLGHISIHCRFPPRFPGLQWSDNLPSFLGIKADGFPSLHTWFSSPQILPSGTPLQSASFSLLVYELLGKPEFAPPASISIAWDSTLIAPITQLPSSAPPCTRSACLPLHSTTPSPSS